MRTRRLLAILLFFAAALVVVWMLSSGGERTRVHTAAEPASGGDENRAPQARPGPGVRIRKEADSAERSRPPAPKPAPNTHQAVRDYVANKMADPEYDWKQPINFYGKAVDENQQAVEGASVDFKWTDLSADGTSENHATSDKSGFFSMVNRKGKCLSVTVSKAGYYSSGDARKASFEYANPAEGLFTPDVNTPVLFHLRKKGLMLLAMLFLPAFLPAKSKGGFSGSLTARVRVLNRQTVGLFDTVTLRSADPSALLNWLNENGFHAPTNMAPVIGDYVHTGWVFVAARLHDEGGGEAPRATHPLAFTFKTAKPVYPLRLTAVGAASCRIDLYVFGPGRAKVPGFTVRRCEAPRYDAGNGRPRMEAGELRIRHRELRSLVAEAPVATKLSAVLDPTGMAHDAYVDWAQYSPAGSRVYSRGAALTLSANVSALLFMALVLGWWVLSQTKHGFPVEKWGPWLAPAALAVGIAVYFVGVPKVRESTFRTARAWWAAARNDSLALAVALGDELEASNGPVMAAIPARPLMPSTLEKLLQATAQDLRSSGYYRAWDIAALTNCFTGEAIRFEASPGNVVLRPIVHGDKDDGTTTGGTPAGIYELVWHDLDGAEAITNLVPPWRR